MRTRLNPIFAPSALPGSLVSFEALLLLYMFAGFYKGDPRFAWLPVDATALFFALSVVVGSFIIVLNPIYKRSLPLVLAAVCLVTWFMVSLTWSPSRIYGPDKVFYMATLCLWGLIGGALIIAPNPERIRRLFSLMLLLAVWMGIEALIAYQEAGGVAIYVGSANYLMLGRICGLGMLVALAGWMYSPTQAASWLCLILFLGLAFVVLLGGGRGPMLATAFALLIPLGLAVRLSTHKIRYYRTLLSVFVLLAAMVGTVMLYVAATGELPGTLKRFERFLGGAEAGEFTASEGDRVAHYINAIELWSQAPVFGHGAGSYPLLTGQGDVRSFPHNMFLEVLAETGLSGLVFLIALLATLLRPVSLERLRRDPQALCATMLFASILFDCMVSGDLADNRVLFMLIGLLALFALPRPATAGPALAPGGQQYAPASTAGPGRRATRPAASAAHVAIASPDRRPRPELADRRRRLSAAPGEPLG